MAASRRGDPAKKRRTALGDQITAAYVIIAGYLALLPEPVVVPPVDPRDSRPAIEALDRARRSPIRDQLIPEREKAALASACLSWLNAFEMMHAAIVRGPDGHRLDNIEAALARIVAATEMLNPGRWPRPRA